MLENISDSPAYKKPRPKFRGTPVKFIYSQLGGQTMTVAWAVLTLGTALALVDKLSVEYVSLLGVVQTLVMARAAFEDKYVKQTQIKNGGNAK